LAVHHNKLHEACRISPHRLADTPAY